MYIKTLKLKNFRCFTDRQFTIDGQFIFVQGNNGIGKTTFLEALHYGGHLRSFRTLQHNDLIAFGEQYFFVSIELESQDMERSTITIGYSPEEGKQVKLNAKTINTHKELSQYMRIITLTADDIQLVSGYPEKRRAFINHTVALADHSHVQSSKKYQAILEQRNSKLFTLRKQGRSYDDELLVWTQSLWEESVIIQQKNVAALHELEEYVNTFLATYFTHTEQGLSVKLAYQARHVSPEVAFEDFKTKYLSDMVFAEIASGRSAFGIHLDDFAISFQQRRARVFASRGQQKLLVFLLKIAQMQRIIKQGQQAILLLDDFLTDFDQTRIHDCFRLLADMPFQTIITNPSGQEFIDGVIPVGVNSSVIQL